MNISEKEVMEIQKIAISLGWTNEIKWTKVSHDGRFTRKEKVIKLPPKLVQRPPASS